MRNVVTKILSNLLNDFYTDKEKLEILSIINEWANKEESKYKNSELSENLKESV